MKFLTFTLILIAATFTRTGYSAPSIKLCIEDSCRQPAVIHVSHETWNEVKALFATPSISDIDEQDNMLTSIRLIEADVYAQLARTSKHSDTASDIYSANSEKLNYKNIRRIIGVLLDNHLVVRHFLRHTVRSKHWKGVQIDGLMMQSLADAKLYILTKDTASLDASLSISAYSKHESVFKLPAANSTPAEYTEDSFE